MIFFFIKLTSSISTELGKELIKIIILKKIDANHKNDINNII